MVRRKSRRKRLHFVDPRCWSMVFCALLVCLWQLTAAERTLCGDVECWYGDCSADGRCLCYPGWQGPGCERCAGRVRLTEPSGVISTGVGNYSKDMKCTWLVESGLPNATIRLEFSHFETECGWDHLYVYDGDSMFAPMVAAYSGLLLSKASSSRLPEIVTHSGSAFVHFYSDAVYNMSGFNLTYRVDGCPRGCSGRGTCVGGVCHCPSGWTGEDCGRAPCRDCVCDGGDCSVVEGGALYELVPTRGWVQGRALHGALVVGDSMWVVGGEGLTRLDQQIARYDFGRHEWETVQPSTPSAPLHRYGHSLVLYRSSLYLFGGTLRDGRTANDLWRWDPSGRSWSQLSPTQPECQNELCPPLTATGHSAVVVDSTMLVFFGHNPDYGYLNVVQEYAFGSDKWEIVQTRGAIVKGGYGHSSVYDPVERQVLVFGGYHSQTTTGVVVDCLYAYRPSERLWTLLAPSSSHRYLHSAVLLHRTMLVFGGNTHNDTAFSTGDKCFSADLLAYDLECDSWQTLPGPSSMQLERFGHSAVVYNQSLYIFGGFNGQMLANLVKYTPGNKTEKAVLSDNYRVKCDNSCSSRPTCKACVLGSCMWCISQQRCLETNAYAATFPLAQCTEWTTTKCSALSCEDFQTCSRCQEHERCGWCDDGSQTGKGRCMDGAASGPLAGPCPAHNWHFTGCPECQCNGHSTCNGSSECLQPCLHRTQGLHCEHCISGYHGNPANGGNCTPCFCNNHGSLCHRETGKCNCTTKGIIGPNCDRCDEQNHYVGSPQEEGGTCFYNLSIDFQYTFNLSSEDYYRNINFMNVPIKVGNDVEFTISCSGRAYVNISIGSGGQPPSHADGDTEPMLLDSRRCDNIKLPFYDEKHNFGSQNTTFFVYVFNFTTPFVLQISFSQHRALDLLQFFITFSSCFLSLLIIAAILWKIKQKYDLYRRRQQLFVEMEQMASRPFAGVTLELDGELDGWSKQLQDGVKQGHPTPVALEPCASGKAAVLSLIVRLPTGGQEHTARRRQQLFVEMEQMASRPFAGVTLELDGELDGWSKQLQDGVKQGHPTPVALEPCASGKAAVLSLIVRLPTGGQEHTATGQSGLAIASALVSLGTLCKTIKEDGKSDCWKPSSHPGTCI
uniref:Putative attractin and platelet-activating factor acetylhydrolase n=1 Tax=Ixodes ricinus TaxID=34613 RepID=A0A6B0VI15_IXORI